MPVHTLTVLLDGGTARRIRMADVRGIRIVDERLRDDLDTALSVALSAAREHTRSFTIHTRGEGERRLEVSYLVEAPVWKATYRLLLAAEGAPQIQGWAVVDNTTDEDWSDISLSLVSGLPVSFTHDLYTARYVPRPEVAATEQQSIAPPVVEEAWSADADPAFPAPAAAAPMMVAGGAPQARAMTRASRRARPAVTPVTTETTTRSVGDLFGYDIDHPVTIGAHRSALVPIVLAPFDGQSILLYNPRTREENPVSAVELTNTTGLTLEGGPVTVLDGDTYAGEAMIEPIRDGETRMVPYAVELGVRADSTSDTRFDKAHQVVLERGTMTASGWEMRTATYTFTNKTHRERTVVIEHPHPGVEWEVTAEAPAVDRTPTVHRFRVALPAGVTTFRVTDRRQTWQVVELASVGDDDLAAFAAAGELDHDASERLTAAVADRRQLAGVRRELADAERQRDTLVSGQERIRQNLGSLGPSSQEQEYRADLVARLRTQEGELDRLEERVRELEAEQQALTTRIADHLAGVHATVETPAD